MRDPMNQELDDLRGELAAVKSQRDEALSNEGYKDNVLGDMSRYVQAQYAIKDSRIRALESAGHGLSGCLKVLFLRRTMPEGVEMALLAWQKAIAPQSETKGESV